MDADQQPTDPVRPTIAERIEAAKADPETVRDTAVHEAGHVVCSVATGTFPDGVELGGDGDHLGITLMHGWGAEGWHQMPDQLRPAAVGEVAVLIAGDLAVDLDHGEDEHDHLPFLLGEVLDPVGQRAFMRRIASAVGVEQDDGPVDEVDESTDVVKMRRLVEHLDRDATVALLTEAHDLAGDVLWSCRADVERVTAALLTDGRLDGDQLFGLLEDGVADRYARDLRRFL